MFERSQSSCQLLRQFREFHAEVVRLRRLAEQETRGELASSSSSVEAGVPFRAAVRRPGAEETNSSVAVAEEPVQPRSSQPDDSGTQQIWQEMANYLDQQMYEVQMASSSLSHDLHEEMIYVMAAYADEVFVYLEGWPGKVYWRDRLMELRLFRTQIAGQEIFRRIDKLLTRRDFGTDELAAVYLMVLALGFRGEYLRDPVMLDFYRKNLFNRLLMTNPDLHRQSHRLFPKAYLHTVPDGAPVRLPEPRTWWLVVAGVVGLWLLSSTIAWLALTNPVRGSLDVAMNSLERVTKQQATTNASTSTKWLVFPFAALNGGFRLELPASLPFPRGSTSGPPLLIGVQGTDGTSAGSGTEIQAWLSIGTVSWNGNAGGLAATSNPVVSVAQLNGIPAGIVGDQGALYFLVTPRLAPSELYLHPQLTFPAQGKYALTVGSIVLYLPGKSTAGVP